MEERMWRECPEHGIRSPHCSECPQCKDNKEFGKAAKITIEFPDTGKTIIVNCDIKDLNCDIKSKLDQIDPLRLRDINCYLASFEDNKFDVKIELESSELTFVGWDNPEVLK